MPLQIRRVQAWCGEIPDRPGAAAGKLAYLNEAGAELEFLFTRPNATSPETSVLFVAPINGPEQVEAARKAGLGPALDVAMLVVEGDVRPGISYDIMSRLAIAGINLRGLSVSCIGKRFAAYLAFDSVDTVTMAIQILATID
jgi:hypothetical protein